jgi:hypothetical protein
LVVLAEPKPLALLWVEDARAASCSASMWVVHTGLLASVVGEAAARLLDLVRGAEAGLGQVIPDSEAAQES